MTNLLIVFVKNLIPGKVKSRIAKHLGEDIALEVYRHLINSTKNVVQDIPIDKRVSYSSFIDKYDTWDENIYQKVLQEGDTLGEKMYSDIIRGQNAGYKKIVLVGSDIYDLSSEVINEALNALNKFQCVVGPALDGGYYLIGFQSDLKDFKSIFLDVPWSTDRVLSVTEEKLRKAGISYKLLKKLSDVDRKEDIPQEIMKKTLQKYAIKDE